MTETNRSFSRIRIIFVATTFFLVVLSLYSFVEIRNLIDSSGWLNHTNEVKISLQKISATFFEAENNQKNFLLTGDSSCLNTRDSAISLLRVQFGLVENLTKDNPAQSENLQTLQSAINERLLSMAKVLSGYSPMEMSADYKSNIAEGIRKTKIVMDIINKMSASETELLQQRTQKYTQLALITPLVIIGLFLGALLILWVSYLRINSALQLSRKLEKTVIENAVQMERTKELQNIFAQVPVTMVLYSKNNFEVEVINESALHMWGKTYNEVNKKPLFEISPELKEVMQPILTNILKTAEPFIGKEFPVNYMRHGKLHNGHFDFTYQPIKNNKEIITGIVAVATEVTEQVIARKKIEESEQRYHQLIYSSPSAIGILYGEDLVITIANKPIIEIWGKGIEIIGKKYFEALPELAEQGYKEVFAQVYKTGIAYNAVETPVYILQNGVTTLKYYNFILFPHRNINGETEGIGIIATEVTSQAMLNNTIKENEQKYRELSLSLEEKVKERTTEIHKTNEVLRASEERYHRMVEEVQDYAIILLDKHGIIENWNKGAEHIKGYKSNEIIGKYFSLFYTAEDRANDIPEKLLALATEKGKAADENWRVRKDGSRFWGNVVITALRDNENKIIGFVKVTRDLTEKKAADDTLKLNSATLEQKNIELEKMNKELQSFAYISSHDLQEPLRKIQTFATLITEKEENNLSDKGKDIFNRMQEAARRMQSLIQDLLAYSRTTTSERKFEKTDLNTVLEEVKEDLKEELNEKHASIAAANLCEANIIPFQFRQLMHNLIGNALKFSNPEAAPRIEIKSNIAEGLKLNNPKLLPYKKYCHISISDNGIGFEQQYNEKVFEVFQQVHGKKNEYNGTGIGLSIVKKIVENHEGIISAHSELNKGAKFDIYIPAL